MALVLMPPPPIMEVATYPFFYNGVYYPAGTPVWPVSQIFFFAKQFLTFCVRTSILFSSCLVPFS
jgi:hypothetical protein